MIGNVIDVPKHLIDRDWQAAFVSDSWESWDKARSGHKAIVNEVEKYVYATDTTTTSNSTNSHSHKTNRPKICQIADNLKANYLDAIIPHGDWLQFESYDEDSASLEKKSNAIGYLKTKHRRNGLYDTVRDLLNDWVLSGNCFVKVDYIREYGAEVNGEKPILFEGPKPQRIDPSDIVFNPLAKDFESSPKIVRSVKTVGDVAWEAENIRGKEEYTGVLRNALDLRTYLSSFSVEDINSDESLAASGFGNFANYIKSGYVEFLDYYGDLYDLSTGIFYKDHHITVVDRKFVITNEPNPSWDGKPYIYQSTWRSRRNNLWGMGPLENLIGLQYRLNHLENSRADAFDEMVGGDLVIVGDVEITTSQDGRRIFEIMSERGSVSYLTPDTTVLNADFQIQDIENQMELYAGAPREAMGIRTPGEKTKFEVQSLQNSAGRIFQHKTNHFERTMLEKIVNAEMELGRRFIDKDVASVLDHETGVELFVDITKEDLKVNGKMIPVGARHYARQAQLAQELAQFQQVGLSDPSVAVHFPGKNIAKMWESALGYENSHMYEEFGRIPEQLEAERLMKASQDISVSEDAAQLPPDQAQAALTGANNVL